MVAWPRRVRFQKALGKKFGWIGGEVSGRGRQRLHLAHEEKPLRGSHGRSTVIVQRFHQAPGYGLEPWIVRLQKVQGEELLVGSDQAPCKVPATCFRIAQEAALDCSQRGIPSAGADQASNLALRGARGAVGVLGGVRQAFPCGGRAD